MHIDEVREENSGIVQGYFVKRQRCQKEGEKGVYITWRDFNLRNEIFLFGKKGFPYKDGPKPIAHTAATLNIEHFN